jgi:HEAT repeat protein
MTQHRTTSRLACLMLALGAGSPLSAQQHTATVPALTAQLQSPDLADRTQAVLGLLELGQGAKDAFPSLLTVLADDEALDTIIAVRALYAKPRPATDAAKLAVALELDTKACAAAAWELSRIGLPAGGEAAPALIAALQNPDKHVRNFVVVALATTAAPTRDVTLALLRVLKDEGSTDSQQANYKYSRASAAIALGMLGAEAREAVPMLTAVPAGKGAWELQRAANCFALGRIGPCASNALPALKQALQDTSPIVRAHAANAIQAIAPPNETAGGIIGTASAADIPTLICELTSGSKRPNSKVIEGLRALGEFAGTAGPVAKKNSRRVAPPVHESISLAIGYLDSLSQPPSPREIARQERTGIFSNEVRQYLMALGGVQQGIAPALLEALTQGERDPRVHAIRHLAAIGPAAEEAIPALRMALIDADWLIRREAHRALQRIDASAVSSVSP